MAKKRKKKRKQGSARLVLVEHLIWVAPDNKTKGVTIMSWSEEPNDADHEGGDPDSGAQETSAEPSPSGAMKTLEDLDRLHEDDRDEFMRMAAVQELGPQLREAMNVLLKLSPESMRTLSELVNLPADEQRLLRRTLELPDEVKTALHGLLIE